MKTASDGTEYLELNERQTKTRTGANLNDVRAVTPKVFATPEDPERCPIETYKFYCEKRPVDFCEADHPFYIAPRTNNQNKNDDCWFNKMTIGERKLGNLLKMMASDGKLDSNKRLTNHSTRKHLVQKLRDSGIEPTDIMQISGHKNIQSVMNYSAMSENKHRECSKLLSNSRSNNTSTPIMSESNVSSQCTGSVVLPTNHTGSTTQVQQSITAMPSQGAISAPIQAHPDSVSDNLPHPLQTSGSFNESVSVNTRLNSLFSGAVVNIQNFNLNMK